MYFQTYRIFEDFEKHKILLMFALLTENTSDHCNISLILEKKRKNMANISNRIKFYPTTKAEKNRIA